MKWGSDLTRPGVVAFAFGVPKTLRSNRLIGEIASAYARAEGALIYTQHDVPVESGIDVTYIEQQRGEPPPTLRIARAAALWAKKKHIDHIWIVAAQPHIWRCERDLLRAFRETGTSIWMDRCREIDAIPIPDSEWFCRESEQERTRSPGQWEKRERILRRMPFFIYKRVAS